MLLAGSTLALAASASAAASAESSPKPKPSPKPPFTFGGFVRSYDFTRQNASGFPQTLKAMNQASVNTAVSLRGAYRFNNGPFSVAATYLYADPGSCIQAASHLSPPCGKHTFVSQGSEPVNPDDTLPGYALSTLYEAYVEYKTPALTVRVGDQVINTPWAPSSDTRLKPSAYEGVDASYKFSAMWSAEATYMSRFENRVSSAFEDSTLLTSFPSGAAGTAPNMYTPGGGPIRTPGFAYGRLSYAYGNIAANAHYYAFIDIANALWLDARYAAKAPGKPFVALQLGSESNAGRSVVGKIQSTIAGIQIGSTPVRNLDVAFSYNYIPGRSDTIALPYGVSCGSNNQIKTVPGVTFPYFLPSGGTTNCLSRPDGTTSVYYGGWASPYSDSFATDPLFSSEFSQTMVDRRSPGQSIKLGATLWSSDKRLRLIASKTWYSYGNEAGMSPTQELDLDGTWYFRTPGLGAYRGFSLRHRYAERTQADTQLFGGTPLFKYNRTQLEYDF
ncbi:MAG TPA: hypothetical protein VFW34_02795 [Candidatus Rubrimentiphilum sp.]|nr:hypothetical protein [Candidatus Rubrimentiphilum sp.]